MAITSEIIGKLGGADVEVTPVEGTASGSSNSEEILHTVDVPEGETWLVAAYGNLKSNMVGSPSAQLVIGATELPPRAPDGIIGLAHVGAGTDRKSTRLNSSHTAESRMPSSA